MKEWKVEESGQLTHSCGRAGEWEDCDKHPDQECYALACGKCGVWERDCKVSA